MSQGYRGQMANAFTKGLQQGYGVVDTAVTNKQNRELQAKEANALATQREDQLKTNKVAREGMDKTQQLQQVKLDAIEAVKLDDAAKKVPALLTEWIDGKVEGTDVRQFLTNNPSLSSKLGLKDIKSVRGITPAQVLEKDSALYEHIEPMLDRRYYMIPNPDISELEYETGSYSQPDMVLDEKAYNDDLLQVAEALEPTLMMADNLVINKYDLAVATGTSRYTLSTNQRATQEKLAGINQKVKKVTSTNAELMGYAEAEVDPKGEKESEEDYNKRLNKAFVALKRNSSSKGGSTPADIKKLQYLESVVANKDNKYSATQVTQAEGMLRKMRETGTQTNIGDAITRGTDLTETNEIKPDNKPISLENPEGDVTADMAKKESEFELSKKYNTKFQAREDAYISTAKVVKDTKSIADDLDKAIANGEYKSGWFDTKLEWLAQRDPTGILYSSVQQLKSGADLDTIGADVLKAYSGASATEQEFARTMLRIFGDPNMQEEERLDLFNNYRDKTEEQFRTDTRYMLRNHRYSTVKNAYEATTELPEKPKKPEQVIKQSNKKTLEGFNYAK